MRKVLAALAVLGMVGGLLVLLTFMGGGGSSSGGGTAASGCTVDVDTAGEVTELTEAEQQDNARVIVETGLKLQIPQRGLIVAIATAMQESTLRNLDYGDRDSVGLFQQRAPWGSVEERTTPAISAMLFFTGGRGGQPGLMDIAGWADMSIAEAAQAVQVSAFPDAYARWSSLATSVVTQVTGGSEAPLCGGGTQFSGAGCTGAPDLGIYQNGQIPAEALCALKFTPGHSLRADAAAAAEQMAAAYEAHFGAKLCVTDSYRDLATQVRLKAEKGAFAATPGTSNHGWGQALDLCGGINSFTSAPHIWMKANGPKFGWINPPWAQPGQSTPEPWHWEFGTS